MSNHVSKSCRVSREGREAKEHSKYGTVDRADRKTVESPAEAKDGAYVGGCESVAARREERHVTKHEAETGTSQCTEVM